MAIEGSPRRFEGIPAGRFGQSITCRQLFPTAIRKEVRSVISPEEELSMNAKPRISRYAALLAVPIVFAVAVQAEDLGRRSFKVQLPASAGDQPIRLANLAGRIEIVPGTADPMNVETTVYAQGKDAAETQTLLQHV